MYNLWGLNPTPTGWFWVRIPLQAARFIILKFTTSVRIYCAVVEEGHPYEFSDNSNNKVWIQINAFGQIDPPSPRLE